MGRYADQPEPSADGLAVSSLIGLVIGIAAGVFPMYRAALSPLLTVVSMIRRWRSCRCCLSSLAG